MLRLILVFILLFVSCASESKQSYKLESIANHYKTWKWCTEKHDLPGMPKVSRTGKLCYWHKECMKRWFKKKCRPILLVCTPTNIDCMTKYDIYNKEIF